MFNERRFRNTSELLIFPKDFKITVDIDGVLAYSLLAVLNKLNNHFDENFIPKDIVKFHSIFDLVKSKGISEKEAKLLEYQWWYGNETLFESPPVPGAVAFMERLCKAKVDYFIPTSRISSCAQGTLAWFDRHMPFVDKNRILLSDSNDIKIAQKEKIDKIVFLNPDFHLEDSLSQSAEILNKTNKTRIVVVPHNYNQDIEPNERLFMVEMIDGGPNFWPVYRFFKNYFVAQSY